MAGDVPSILRTFSRSSSEGFLFPNFFSERGDQDFLFQNDCHKAQDQIASLSGSEGIRKRRTILSEGISLILFFPRSA